MKLIDTLRKLGILRFGANTGVYHNAKDRPLELQSEGIYNAEKDTVDKDDLKKVVAALKPASPAKISNKFFIASVIVGVLFMFLSLASTLWWLLVILWVTWVAALWLISKGRLILSLRFGLVFTCLIIFSFLLVIFTVKDSDSASKSSGSNSTTKKLTSAECQPYVQKYNNKVLKVSADGLQGTIGIKIDASNGCKLKGWYNVLLSYNLPQNPYKRDAGVAYHYTVLLRSSSSSERTKSDGLGDLSAVYMNQAVLPGPFDDSVARAKLYSNGQAASDTRYFSWGYMIDTNFSEERYNQILNNTRFEIVNGTPFMEEKSENVGGISSYSWTVNEDEAAAKGTIVKSYNLTITE